MIQDAGEILYKGQKVRAYIDTKDWKITQRICNVEEPADKRFLFKEGGRLHVDHRQIIDCLKRNFVLAATYYETDQFKMMQSSPAGMDLAAIMRTELGYSRNSFWWDIVHKRRDLYLIAKREIRECMFKTDSIEQTLNFLDAQEKEILTRGTMKGINMHDREAGRVYAPGADTCSAEKPMTVKRHKQITDLAYKLKAVMDKEVPDLKGNELCMLGEIMQRIGNLK